ncbi:MAG: hypothetical protein F4057_10615 [Acidobacteria bacterium]|nr:hypothetical protein [Acidobacteriota bacterium]MYI75734.1 hypothetical protein [Acidobacteriota bacterium]
MDVCAARLAAAASAAVLATTAPAAPLPGGESIASCCARDLPYEVVDGLAIHDGDIVLGPAEEAAVQPARARHVAAPRRDAALPYPAPRTWPEGVVPYVLDEELTPAAAESVLAAIEEWNSKTAISLVPRSSEADYVRFIASKRCASYIGRKGGPQNVWSGCGPISMAHEIGHAVGLAHEHQRSDRDERLMVRDSETHGPGARWTAATRSPSGPYDYRSVMHYDPGDWDTIPPGIELARDAGLSAGDVDGVARLYGHPPKETTIATNPPGLTVWVDEVAVETPARFAWEAGTEHTLAVLAEPQERHGRRYLFGRWNDGAPRRRSMIAGQDGTWLEANFIAQHRARARAEPPDSATVEVSPPQEWHTARTEVQLGFDGDPATELNFWRWNLPFPAHGSNPTQVEASRLPEIVTAHFTAWPVFRIVADAPAFLLRLDGRLAAAPAPVAVTGPGQVVAVRIDETQAVPWEGGSRYRFERWGDGVNERARELPLPADGGELEAIFSTEHSFWAAAWPAEAGEVSVQPPSDDGFYTAGAAITAIATPNNGWELARWTGDAGGVESATIRMDAPRAAEAWFTRTRQLQPGSAKEVALPSGEPGYRFALPDGASGIALKFVPESAPPPMEMEVRGFASRRDGGLQAWERLHAYAGSRDLSRAADFVAKPGDGQLEIAIGYDTEPPLDPEALYFVVLVTDGTPVSGTLSLEVTSSGPRPPRARAWPRAFTFVSDAGSDPHPQVFELRNEGGTAMQFEASSEASWLAADPPRGSVPPGESAEIAIRVSAQVPADTHAATLNLDLGGPYGPLSQHRLPVTFVAIPPPSAGAAQ